MREIKYISIKSNMFVKKCLIKKSKKKKKMIIINNRFKEVAHPLCGSPST